MPMIAITTRRSTSVNPFLTCMIFPLLRKPIRGVLRAHARPRASSLATRREIAFVLWSDSAFALQRLLYSAGRARDSTEFKVRSKGLSQRWEPLFLGSIIGRAPCEEHSRF